MRNRTQLLFAGVFIILSGALLLSPPTGWLVRMQITDMSCCRAQHSDRQAAARRFTNDFQVQLAQAVESADDRYPMYTSTNGVLDPRVRAMHDLAIRYPNQPAIYAEAVRYALSGSVVCNRKADEKLLAVNAADAATDTNTPNGDTPPARLAAYLTACATGERVDPGNAYFPIYRAYGLFAGHMDRDAITELVAASNKPRYQDYTGDETLGRLKLADARNGGKDALSDTTVSASVLNPEYINVRDLARLSTSIAIEDERAGNEYQGFVIRRAVRRIGGLMRTDSSTVIGNLVGIAVAAIAANRPGGKDAPGYEKLPALQKRPARVNAYVAYLDHTGHHDEAIAFRTEAADGQAVSAVLKRSSASDQSLTDVFHLAYLWIYDMTLLSAIVMILAAGLVAMALGRTPAIRLGSGMEPAGRWGFGIGVITAMLASAVWFVQTIQAAIANQTSFIEMFLTAESTRQTTVPAHAAAYANIFVGEAVIGLVAIAALLCKPPAVPAARAVLRWAAILTAFAAALVCASSAVDAWQLCAALLVALPFASVAIATLLYRHDLARVAMFVAALFLAVVATMLIGGIAVRISRPIASLVTATTIFDRDPFASTGNEAMAIARVAVAAVVLLVPILVAGCAAIFLRRGRPGSVAAVGALKSAALPAACALLIGYTIMLGVTLHKEAVVNSHIDASLGHEGRYIAAVAHLPWPGRPD